jgi:hypothetical protein
MRRFLVLAALLVSGCATYAEPYPEYGYPAYPAYSYGYTGYAYPAYTYRPPVHVYPTPVRRPHVHAPPKRHRAWAPPAHRHRGNWQRRSDGGERRWDGGERGSRREWRRRGRD